MSSALPVDVPTLPPDSADAAAASALPPEHPMRDGRTTDSPLILAYRGHRPPVRPVWFMRQAGRSCPSTASCARGTDMLDACLTRSWPSEITLQPVRRHRVDAAIFFSDIVMPLRLAGVGVEIVAGRGPVLERRRSAPAADIAALPDLDPDALAPIREGVARDGRRTRSDSADRLRGRAVHARVLPRRRRPVEGPAAARSLMHADPPAWTRWSAGART